MKAMSLFLMIVLITTLYYIYAGFVLTELWFWFIVPMGVIPITIPWAVGLMLTFSIAKGVLMVPSDRNTSLEISQLLIGPALVYLVGWIISTNMMVYS